MIFLNVSLSANEPADNYQPVFNGWPDSQTNKTAADHQTERQKACQKKPVKRKWAEPYYRKAIVYNKQGKYTSAKSAAEQALTFKKNYAPAAYEAGKAAKALEQYDQAISYFKICAKDRSIVRSFQ